MDGPAIEEDSKQFDSVNAPQEDETQPDPDEEMIIENMAPGRVWLVKIPKHLMERWSSINQEDIQLATIRVYHEAVAANGKKPRIMMMLPPNPDGTCDEYELDMVNESVENQIVVAEREKYPGVPHRARTTILTGRVKHECNLRPLFTERYRQRLKQRTLLANTPKKQIMRIEEAGIGGRGSINMLTSGAANQRPFTFGQVKQKPAKGQFERMARMPRNNLLDLLFGLFKEREFWSIKVLREKTQQPEAWLKELLSGIAMLHRSGEHNGMWELNSNYKGRDATSADVPPSQDVEEMKLEDEAEGEDDDDDDENFDEDDDDMEEVS